MPPASSERVIMVSGKEASTQVADDNHLTSNDCKMNRGTKDSDAHALALKRARELQTNLSKEHPSFVKQMLPSHVTRWFLLGLPSEFCRLHLPAFSVEVTLEDESGKIYMVNFHPGKKARYDGGWKRFSVANKLLEGDVVVFHLLRPCHFKVYIMRANDDPTVAEVVSLTNHNVSAHEGKKRKREAATDKVGLSQESVKRSPLLSNSCLEPKSRKFSKEEFPSDTEAFSLSGNTADFEKFKIIVNKEIVDPELSRSMRFKYYKLCCSRKSFLHRKLLENVDHSLAAGIISETVKLADKIKTCKLNISKDDFATWDNTLKGFKNLGMEVRFLLNLLKRLGRLATEVRATDEWKMYVGAKSKLDCIEEKMRSCEIKLVKLKRSTEELEDEMKTMKANIKKCRNDFHEEARAPW